MLADTFRKAGYRVFGLYSFGARGCKCGDKDCTAAGKHPRVNSWQKSPLWSDEQFQNFVDAGHFDSGYGVLCGNGLLVVDIDPRNGGDINWLNQYDCGLVVDTGGGGKHGYFRIPQGAYLSHVKGIKGIDFKTSGFVVGPGSRHASGGTYKIASGSVSDISDAPDELVELLQRDEFIRVNVEGQDCDYSVDQVREMLSCIPNDLEYDDYIKIGMALHHAGLPFELWQEWARRGEKYTGNSIHKRWKSFSNKVNSVTINTLLYHAYKGGYMEFPEMEISVGDLGDVDLLRPPGFVGRVAEWIEANNRRQRENLAVASALVAVGNAIGLKYTDDKDGVSTNLFMCCIAGAGTGKEAPQQCIGDLLQAAGVARARSSNIKSEQDIIKSLTLRHQAAFLVIDELGYLFQKLKNAQRSGSAAYLEGVIGVLMSIQGKANGVFGVNSDTFDVLLMEFRKALSKEETAKAENEPYSQEKINAYQRLISDLLEKGGIVRPFLSMIGFTTPSTFEDSVTYENATNGFLRRAFLVIEGENAPPMKQGWEPVPLPYEIESSLVGMYSDDLSARVQYNGDKTIIPTSPSGLSLLESVSRDLDDKAAECDDGTESLYLGAYENVSKVSLILSAVEGLRTSEHVKWAYALVLRDISLKRSLVRSNDEYDHNAGEALVARIIHILQTNDNGMMEGTLINRLRKYKKDNINKALEYLIEKGIIEKEMQGSRRKGNLYRIKGR